VQGDVRRGFLVTFRVTKAAGDINRGAEGAHVDALLLCKEVRGDMGWEGPKGSQPQAQHRAGAW